MLLSTAALTATATPEDFPDKRSASAVLPLLAEVPDVDGTEVGLDVAVVLEPEVELAAAAVPVVAPGVALLVGAVPSS